MSGKWNRHAVSRNDLRLVAEYLTAPRIHQYLQPVHVIDAVFLMVAESLHAGEILKALASAVQKRLVHPEIVGISMHPCDRLLKCDYLTP